MSDFTNRRMLLSKRPIWTATTEDFTLEELPADDPGVGEVLVRVLWIAFDPAMRGWMNDGPSYAPPVPIGDVMRGHGVGQVVRSGVDAVAVGTLVTGNFGWQTYALASFDEGMVSQLEHVHDPSADRPVARRVPDGMPPTSVLGVLGTTGLTAYFGMLELGSPRPGDIVLVSGAAGATGSVAGPPAMPMVVAPASLAIWPATEPVAPAAPDTRTMSPGRGLPSSSIPK